MSNEEKILEMLETQRRLLGEIATGQAALKDRIGRLEEGQTVAAARLEHIETDVSGVKVLIDTDIRKQLDILEEADEALADKLDRVGRTLEKVEQMAEETADKMDVVYTVVRQHSTDIAELKRAQ